MYPCETSLYHAILTGTLVLVSMVIALLAIILRYQQRKFSLHRTTVHAETIALEKERSRIAGDLHDDLGASLSAIKLSLHRLSATNEKEAQLITSAENYIDEAMLKLKRISFNLMPRVLERRGLKQALYEFIDMAEQATGIEIHFGYTCPELISDKNVHIYRIVQETLNNTARHSGAGAATVELVKWKKKILLRIADNGRGFNKTKALKNGAGLGLQNIMARADLLKAKVFLSTSPGSGVEYLIQIPEDI